MIENIINVLSLLQFMFLVYVFIYRDRKIREVKVCDNDVIITYKYSKIQIEKERDEKSVLSSHGHKVKWDKYKKIWRT